MGSFTSKLGLYKPDPVGEDVDIEKLNQNMDKLDGQVGALTVLDNVTPPDSALVDGQVVTERGTGHTWVAIKNTVSGLFEKKWIANPCIYTAYTPSSPFASMGAYTPWGWSNFSVTDSINTTDANRHAGDNYFTIPYKGIWHLNAVVSWGNNNTAGLRTHLLTVNGGTDNTANENSIPGTNGYPGAGRLRVETNYQRAFNAGDIVGQLLWQTSGTNADVATILVATLVVRT